MGYQLGRLGAGLVRRALGAIFTILRTAAGLDRNEMGKLDFAGVPVLSMNGLGLVEKVRERPIEEFQYGAARVI